MLTMLSKQQGWMAVSGEDWTETAGSYNTREDAERAARKRGWQLVCLTTMLVNEANDNAEPVREDVYEVGGNLVLSRHYEPDMQYLETGDPFDGCGEPVRVPQDFEPRPVSEKVTPHAERAAYSDPLEDWKQQQLNATPQLAKWAN